MKKIKYLGGLCPFKSSPIFSYCPKFENLKSYETKIDKFNNL